MPLSLVQAIFLVENLDEASERMEKLGLDVLHGGRHAGRGTANRIVALGEQYIELLGVVDEREAAASPMGKPVLDALASHGEGLARWSVRADGLQGISARLDLPVQDRHRTLPDGTRVHWQAVGVEDAWASPWRCAFMSWEDDRQCPARMAHSHPIEASAVASIDVGVPDRGALAAWLGGPVPSSVKEIVGEKLGPRSLTLATPSGEITLS